MDSYRDLVVEDGGSIELSVGPEAPDGYESKRLPLNPGKAFFVYFRLYDPLDACYIQTWKLNDPTRVSSSPIEGFPGPPALPRQHLGDKGF